MDCSNCGAALIEGAKFCGECGASEPQATPQLPPTSGLRGWSLVKDKRMVALAAAVILMATSGYYFYSKAQSSDDLSVDFPWPVRIGDKCGYIDQTGKLVIGLQFTFATPFDIHGMALTLDSNNNPGFIDENGKVVITSNKNMVLLNIFGSNDLAPVSDASGKIGFINRTGKLAIPFKSYDAQTVSSPRQDPNRVGFHRGLAAVSLKGRWGYIDTFGKYAIAPQFEDAFSFDSSGMAAVKINGKFGYIDRTGSIIIKPQFDFASPFGGRALTIVAQNAKASLGLKEEYFLTGFIDRRGNFVINPQYPDAGQFNSGLAAVFVANSLHGYGFIDTSGKMAIDPQSILPAYIRGRSDFGPNGLAVVKSGEGSGYIDVHGKIVIEPKFDQAAAFTKSGLASVRIGDHWGFIDQTGKIVIAPQFDGPFCAPVGIHFRN